METKPVAYNSGIDQGEDVLRLHANENPYGMSPAAREAALAAFGRAQYYPDSDVTDLRRCIAAHYGVDRSMVLVGNGSDELALAVSIAFLSGGKTALTTDATFPGYKLSAAAVRANCRVVPLDGYQIDAAAFVATLREGPAVAFLCNPHNPAGTMLQRQDLLRILDTATSYGTIPLFDEAYAEFAGDDFTSAIPMIKEGARALVMRTFSKAYGLAGFRIGYLIGPSDLILHVTQTKGVVPFSVNHIGQKAAMQSLNDQAFIQRVRSKTAETKAYLNAELDRLRLPYVPSQSNFVLVKVPMESRVLTADLLREYRILVRDTELFGFPHHIRITLGTMEQMQFFSKALERVLYGWKTASNI